MPLSDLIDEIYGRAPAATAPIRPFTDRRQEESALDTALGKTLGGLAWVGGVLDKTFGGRALRGALGGRPREIASVLPLSDTLGLTDEKDRVSGEDLLKQAGLLEGEGTKGTFELRDLAGPLVEAALDPASYLTLGGAALTRAGQAAKRLGALPQSAAGRIGGFTSADDVARGLGLTAENLAMAGRANVTPAQAAAEAAQKIGVNLDDVLHKPLAGIAGLGSPFSRNPSVVLGTGATGQRVARGLDWLGDLVKYSGPGRYASSLFDPAVRGSTDPRVQKYLRGDFGAAAREAGAVERGAFARDVMGLDRAGALDDTTTLRRAVEQTLTGPLQPELAQTAANVASRNARRLKAEQALGIPVQELSDPTVAYAARGRTNVEPGVGGLTGVGQPLATRHGSVRQREDWLRGIPGGTATINDLVADSRISGLSRSLNQDQAREEVLKRLFPQEWTAAGGEQTFQRLRQIPMARRTGIQQNQLEALAALRGKGQAVARGLGGLSDAQVQAGGLFLAHPLADDLSRGLASAQSRSNAGAVHDLIAQYATPTPGPGSYTALDALKATGLGNRAGRDYLVQKLGLARRGDLRNMFVDRNLVDDLTRVQKAAKAAGPESSLVAAHDSLTNLFKAFQTAPFPAFNIRNLISGLFQNVKEGAASGEATRAAAQLRKGEIPAGIEQLPYFARQGLTPSQAADQFRELLFAQRAGGRGLSHGREIVGRTADPGENVRDLLVGLTPAPNPLQAYGRAAQEVWEGPKRPWDPASPLNPLNVAGVGGFAGIPKRAHDTFAPVKAGRQFGDWVDDLTRSGMFYELLRQGESPLAAAQRTTKSHYDYAALSRFEKGYLRRIVPFYSFTKAATKDLAEDLLTRPGGGVGQMLRLTNDLRDQKGGFVPPYLGSGLAIPVGAEKEGTQRYLTRLDLPYEGPLGLLDFGPSGVSRTLGFLLGQLGPVPKTAIELGTGKQLYSGRDLNDLYGPLPTSEQNELLFNSPLGRLYTTGRTLTDPRKLENPEALLTNLLTGVRLSDVDVDKQKRNAARDVVENVLGRNNAVQNVDMVYVKPENVGKLSPEEVELLRLYKTLEKRSQEEARKQRGSR